MKSRHIVVLLLVISWAPIIGAFQLVSYTGPILVIAVGLLSGTVRLSKFDMLAMLLLAILFLGTSGFYGDTGLVHPALGFLTYASSLLLVVRFRMPESAASTFINVTAYLSIAEGTIGIIQLVSYQGGLFFYRNLAAGDMVVGTLGTNSHLFAVKMLFQALLLFYVWRYVEAKAESGVNIRVVIIGLILALIGALLASALAATLFFGVTVLLLSLDIRRIPHSLLRFRVPRRGAVGGGLIIALVIFFLVTQSGNARLILRDANRFVEQGISANPDRFQKIIVFQESIREVLLADTGNTLLGVGLGRYSSRAAMMLSGGYLRNHPGWVPVSRSEETDTFIYPRWNPDTWSKFDGSIMSMPTNSIQSVLTEFGVIGTVLLLGYIWTLLRRSRTRYRHTKSELQKAFLRAAIVFVFCLIAVSFTDLWLEYAQLTVFVYLVMGLSLSRGWSGVFSVVRTQPHSVGGGDRR